jgi:hypothetical protein
MVEVIEVSAVVVGAALIGWRVVRSNLFRARSGGQNRRREDMPDDPSGYGGPAGGGLG